MSGLDEIYDDVPCGVVTTTADGTIVHVNRTFLEWTGFRRDELIGAKRFVDLLTPGGRIYHETHYMPMLQMHSAVRELALEIVTAEKERLPVLINAKVDDTGARHEATIRIAVFEAIERRAYERELLAAKQRAEESEAHAKVLARTIQSTLIPPAVPSVAGLDLGASYRPAGNGEEIGGDFYDIFQIAADDWVIAIGDVCGKGVDAAVVTALVRYTTRAAAVEHPSTTRVLDVVNEVLLRHETDRFCTLALLRLRRRDERWTITIALAGHPPPLWKRGPDGPLDEVGKPGMLLGVFEAPAVHEVDVTLDPGDVLVLYTDGVTEARGDEGFFGEDRLISIIRHGGGDAQDHADRVLASVLAFQHNDPRDDCAVVVIRAPQ